MDDLLKSLTQPQREAVLHVDGPMLMLAGPGSGKTRVVTSRIVNLLHQGISAHQILALTFTNKAADEMKLRLARDVPDTNVWVGTFHRFAARLLRQHAVLVGLSENYTIYDTRDSRQALLQAIETLDFPITHATPEAIQHAISWAKNNLVTAEQYSATRGHELGSIVERVYPAYQKRLLECNAVDFDDLLLHTAMLLRENPELRSSLDQRYQYILVDEYQDTNLAQYAIVRALSIDYPNLSVTGDPDQSIYGWRGANLGNILEFEKDFANVKVVRLEENWRSTKSILVVADQLISNNTRRKHKELFTDNPQGSPVRLTCYTTQKTEAEGIAGQIAGAIHSGRRRPRDFAIFYRINALSRSLEFALRDLGVPYQMIHGLEFFQRKEIKDVLGYLQVVNNPRDDVALMRIINTPARAIGKKTVERLRAHAIRYGLSMLNAARESGLIESLNKRAAVAVAKFVAIIDFLGAVGPVDVEEILGHVLSQTAYRELFTESDDPQDQERLANIEELLTAARQFDEQNPGGGHFEEFLEQASLVNDTDDWETETDKVTLMTMHAAKGLEFPAVFVIAVEEGLLPHERSRHDPSQLEEERRLLFVAITRAEEELQLSLVKKREFRGQTKYVVPSSFLMELPREEMELIGAPLGGDELAEESWGDDADWNEAGDDGEVTFNVEEFAETPPPASSSTSSDLAATLTTAAEMVSEQAAELPQVSPDEFHQGMVVRHPEYGLGKIVALGGGSARRVATVDFASGARGKKFILNASALRPAT
ncbi:MAG: UvrD-helicase domain-containing protein [Planctomycetes bacterium]|nr:UvrD-helicase domain-containing protein [Planctomycetota bacterium]